MNHGNHGKHGKLFLEKETFAIRGAIYEVAREMGCGFLEAVYQECLEKELMQRKVPFKAQKPLRLVYKGIPLKKLYIPDLICFDQVIVELKAVNELTAGNKAQLFNYLKASGLRLGLLVNFGHYPKAQIMRIIN